LPTTEEEKKTNIKFVDLAKNLLSETSFIENTKKYTGSLYPEIAKVATPKTRGAIPTEYANVYDQATIIDLSTNNLIWSTKPELEEQAKEIFEEAKEKASEDDLFSRISNYQDSIFYLSSSMRVLEKTLEKDQTETSWINLLTNSLNWIKETVKSSLARVYQSLSSIFDKITDGIDKTVEIIKNKAKGWKDQLVEKFRKIVQGILELSLDIVSGLFGWLSKLKKLAQDKGLTLEKITINIEPFDFKDVEIFGFAVPIPVIMLPKITMEFK
jgi:hypothetical protein